MVSDFILFYSKKWDANDDFSAIPKFSVFVNAAARFSPEFDLATSTISRSNK